MDYKQIEEQLWSSKDESAVSYYLNWPLGIRRSKWFAEYLKAYNFSSIFEVGVMGGRNIKIIEDHIPGMKLGGLDINPLGVKFAQQNIPNGIFYNISAFDIDKLEENWDVIFTMGTMIHLAPDIISEFCNKLISKTNLKIFHLEQVGNDDIINGPEQLNPKKKIINKIRWAPNISKIYKNIGNFDIKINPLPQKIRTSDCTHIVEVDINKCQE